jgi:two-component system response regulator HydG
VTATNQDLAALVRDKRFREDLFYRLNVITIAVPPLRHRPEDVPVLAEHFLRLYAAKNNRRLEGFTKDAMRRLEGYSWPGNVRELENVIERAVVLARGANVELTDLPDNVGGATPMPDGVFIVRVGTPLAEVQQRLLEETLRLTKGNRTLTAKILGIDPKTVFRKLKAGEVEEPPTGEAPSADRPAGS